MRNNNILKSLSGLIFFIFIVSVIAATLLTGCSVENEKNDNELIKNYGKDMTIKVLSGEKSGNSGLCAVDTYNGSDFFYYYLGTVKNVSLCVSYAYKYNGGSVNKSIAFNNTANEFIENNIQAANGVVIENNTGNIIKKSINGEAFKGFDGAFGDSEPILDDFFYNRGGSNINVLFSELSGFKQDGYYRLSVKGSVNVYGVLIYENSDSSDTGNGKWSWTCRSFLNKNDEYYYDLEQSENGNFNYVCENNLLFDIDKAIEEAKDPACFSMFVKNGTRVCGYMVYNDLKLTPQLSKENKKYVINWSGEQSLYDYKSGHGGKINGTNDDLNIEQGVEEVCFIGDPNKKYTNLSIVFTGKESEITDENKNILFRFKDFNFSSSSINGVISCYDREKSSYNYYGQSLTIDIDGLNSVTAGNSSVAAINGLNELNITGSGELSVKAAAGTIGSAGGTGISVKKLNVDITGNVDVYGGNGGNGGTVGNGSAGYSTSAFSEGTRGGVGDPGGNGGNGGMALSVKKITVKKGILVLKGGNGGTGGTGGHGGAGADGKFMAMGSCGGDGGVGGRGGNGSIATSSDVLIDVSENGCYLAIYGNGGAGGTGGQAGRGGSSTNGGDGWAPGKGGSGGAGGNGNIPGCGGSGGSGNSSGNGTYTGSSGNTGADGKAINEKNIAFILGDEMIVSGYDLTSDSDFTSGVRAFSKYDNKNKGVTIECLESSGDNELNFPYEMRITSKKGSDKRHMGGYYWWTNSSANAVFYYVLYAKIPVGYSVEMFENAIGNNSKKYWLTDNKGTGEWKWYVGVTECGSDGVFDSLGYLALTENEECELPGEDEVRWRVGYSNIIRSE